MIEQWELWSSEKLSLPGFGPRGRNCYLPPIAVAAMAVAGAVFSAMGAISQGRAQADAAGANARALEAAAVAEQQQGTIAYGEMKRRGLINRGNTLLALAGSGIDPGEGTPLELLSEQAKRNEFDAQNAQYVHDAHAAQLRQQENQQWAAASAAGSQAAGKAVGALFQGGIGVAGSGLFGSLTAPATETSKGITNVGLNGP